MHLLAATTLSTMFVATALHPLSPPRIFIESPLFTQCSNFLGFLTVCSSVHQSTLLQPHACWKNKRHHAYLSHMFTLMTIIFLIVSFSWIFAIPSTSSPLSIHVTPIFSKPIVCSKATLGEYPNGIAKSAFLSSCRSFPSVKTYFLMNRLSPAGTLLQKGGKTQAALSLNPFKNTAPLIPSRSRALRVTRSTLGSSFFWKRLVPVGVLLSGAFSSYYIALSWILRRQAFLTKEFNIRMLLRLRHEVESHTVYEFYRKRIPLFRFYKRQLFAQFSLFYLDTLEKWSITLLENFGKLAFEDFKFTDMEVATVFRYLIETSRNENRIRRILLLSECLFSESSSKNLLRPPWIVSSFNGTQSLEKLLLHTRETFYMDEMERYFIDPLIEDEKDFDKHHSFWMNAYTMPPPPGWKFLRFTFNESLRLSHDYIDSKITILKMKRDRGFFDSQYEQDTQYSSEETKFLKRYSEGLENQQIFSEQKKGLFYPKMISEEAERLPLNTAKKRESEEEDSTFNDVNKFNKEEEFKVKAIKASEESWNTFMEFIVLSEGINRSGASGEENSSFSIYTLDEERIGLPEYHAECVRNNTLRILQEMEYRKWCRERNFALEEKNGNLEIIPSEDGESLDNTEKNASNEFQLNEALESGYTLRIESPHSMQSLLEEYKDKSISSLDQDTSFTKNPSEGSSPLLKSHQFECSGCGYSVFPHAYKPSPSEGKTVAIHPFHSEFYICPHCGTPKSHFQAIESLLESRN